MAVFDLDGTVCDFVAGFAKFADLTFTRETYDVRKACGMEDMEDADELIHRYYLSGRLSSAPIIDEQMAEFIRKIYDKQMVMFLTARPSSKYPEIVSHTMEWLTTNKLPCDILAFANRKADFLFGEKVDFVVEDNAQQARIIAASGQRTYLIDRQYNRFQRKRKNLTRINTPLEIKTYVDLAGQ